MYLKLSEETSSLLVPVAHSRQINKNLDILPEEQRQPILILL